MSLVQSNGSQDLQIKTVWYAGTNTLQEGAVVVYDTDDTNAPVSNSWDPSVDPGPNQITVTGNRNLRGNRVIDPGLDENGFRKPFAGLVSATSSGKVGPAFVDIVIPRKGDVCNIFNKLSAQKNTTLFGVGSSAAVNEIQVINVPGTLTAGNYQIGNGQNVWTVPLAFGAVVATIQAACDAAFGTNFVTVTLTSANTPLTISLSFAGAGSAGQPHPLYQVNTVALTGVTGPSTVTRPTVGQAFSVANAAVQFVPNQAVSSTSGEFTYRGLADLDLIGVSLETKDNSTTAGQTLVRFI